MPFEPLRVVAPSAEDQRIVPAVGDDGVPVWQAGDTNVHVSQASGLGACQGAIANERVFSDATSTVYVTDQRIVVVASHFAHGTKYSGSGLISPIVRTRVSNARADRKVRGQFLVGQMRYPWVNRIVLSRRMNRRTENTVRLCGTHVSAFGDKEPVMLVVHLDKSADPQRLADELASRVRADRCSWQRTTDEERKALASAAFTEPASLDDKTLPSIALVGSFIVSAASGGEGVFSSQSCAS